MDIITTPKYEVMQDLYSRYFSMGYMNLDINSKFALISLVCYLTERLKKKKPDVTHYQTIYKIIGDNMSEDRVKGLAVVCSDFAYGCTEFPTFGIEDKNIPNKIKELLFSQLPF